MLPALLARFCGGAGVGSRAWVPAWPPNPLTPSRAVLLTIRRPGPRFCWHPPAVPSRSARPVQEAGVHRPGGQQVRAIPQPQKRDGHDHRRRQACITGGASTHADVHVAAALDRLGGLLGVREFPATVAGDAGLLGWLGGFGTVALVGIEGTGSYGAGLARHVTAAGIRVVEVDRPDRQDRRRQGKSDPLGCRQCRPGRPVRPGPRHAGGPGRRGRGDPGADGRQAQCPRRAGPDDQPGQGAGPDRP